MNFVKIPLERPEIPKSSNFDVMTRENEPQAWKRKRHCSSFARTMHYGTMPCRIFLKLQKHLRGREDVLRIILFPVFAEEVVRDEVTILLQKFSSVFFAFQTVQLRVGEHAVVLEVTTQCVWAYFGIGIKHKSVPLCRFLIVERVVWRFDAGHSFHKGLYPVIRGGCDQASKLLRLVVEVA